MAECKDEAEAKEISKERGPWKDHKRLYHDLK
jgi:hypothetical protein